MNHRPRPYGAALVACCVAALALAQSCRASAKAPCAPSVAQLEAAIYQRAKHHKRRYRRWVAKRLAVAVAREAKRTGLPALALLAIAEVESHYGYWVKGRVGELGIWQLIRHDVGPTHALRHAPPDVIAWRKGRRGHWTARELTRNVDIATYVAAHEIAMHARYCYRLRHAKGRLCNRHRSKRWHHTRWFPAGVPEILGSMAHYNTGTKAPGRGYLRKLGRAYKGLQAAACRGRTGR